MTQSGSTGRFQRCLLAGAAACAFLAAPYHASAQASGAPGEASVDEVIVTAQRRAERLEDVPASVSVVSQEALQAAGIVRFQDLGNSLPGVQIARTGAYTQPSIRGISTLLGGPGYENNVAFYLDGYYESNPLVTNGDLANIQDVQVLKGPQGTLYGRNATGGAILVNTLEPSDELTGSLSAGAGSYKDVSFSAYLSGPIAPGLTGSVAAYSRLNDGYIKDVAGFRPGDFENQSLMLKLKYEPTSKISLTLGYNYTTLDDSRGAVYVQYAQLPAGFVGTSERDKSSLNLPPIVKTQITQYRLTGHFETPIGDLTTRTGYGETKLTNVFDFDGQTRKLTTIFQNTSTRTLQQAVDYNIDVIPKLSLLVGGLYYVDHFAVRNNQTYVNDVMVSRTVASQTSEAISGYIDGTYEVTDKLFVTAGARYNREEKELLFRTTLGAVANTLPAPVKATFSSVTPRFVARYEFAESMNVYASYSQGFKTGTFPITATPPSLVRPVEDERVKAYEVGFKGVRGPWRWEAAAYYYDYKDLQVSTTQVVNGLVVQVVGNAKGAEIYGAEAQVRFAPSRAWDVGVSAAYNHSRYTDIDNAVGTGLNPATGLNTTSVQDWSGKDMVRAPAWTANLFANYTFSMLSGNTTLTASLSYSSKFIPNNPSTFVTTTTPPNTNTDQRFWSDGYTLLNLQATWRDQDERYSVSAYVNNVTNKRYMIINAGSTFGSYRQWNEPRWYGARVGYKF